MQRSFFYSIDTLRWSASYEHNQFFLFSKNRNGPDRFRILENGANENAHHLLTSNTFDAHSQRIKIFAGSNK